MKLSLGNIPRNVVWIALSLWYLIASLSKLSKIRSEGEGGRGYSGGSPSLDYPVN